MKSEVFARLCRAMSPKFIPSYGINSLTSSASLVTVIASEPCSEIRCVTVMWGAKRMDQIARKNPSVYEEAAYKKGLVSELERPYRPPKGKGRPYKSRDEVGSRQEGVRGGISTEDSNAAKRCLGKVPCCIHDCEGGKTR